MEGDNDEKEEKPRWRSRLTIKIGGQVSARPLAPRGRSAARAGAGGGAGGQSCSAAARPALTRVAAGQVDQQGCGALYERLEECLGETDRDFRACRGPLLAFRECYDKFQEAQGLQTTRN